MLSVLSILTGALKIAGTVLLFLLKLLLFFIGFLLLLCLLLLFVPFRYKAESEFTKKRFGIGADISFLFRLFKIRVKSENDLEYSVKFGCFTLLSSEKKKKRKKSKKRKKEQRNEKHNFKKNAKSSEITTENEGEGHSTVKAEKIIETESEEKRNIREAKRPELLETKEVKKEEKDFSDHSEERIQKRKKVGKNLSEKLSSLKEGSESLLKKKDAVFRFLNAEGTAEAFGLLFREGSRLLAAFLPKKLSGRLRFGTGDVYTEGKYLSYLCLLYGIYGDHLEILPEWEEKVIEFKIFVDGRIRLFTILKICIKVFFNKNFKKLRKNLDELKQGLGID